MAFSVAGKGPPRVDLGARCSAHAAFTAFSSFVAETAGAEYLVYFNTSRRLPRNAALTLFSAGAHGARPMFRGDVVVVRAETAHMLTELAATYPLRTYIDFPAAKREFADECLLWWYRSTGWADMDGEPQRSESLHPHRAPPAGETPSRKNTPTQRGASPRPLYPGPCGQRLVALLPPSPSSRSSSPCASTTPRAASPTSPRTRALGPAQAAVSPCAAAVLLTQAERGASPERGRPARDERGVASADGGTGDAPRSAAQEYAHQTQHPPPAQ
ncbi:hypothetical protein DFH08DRAFT_1084389 [Mycena albidolilacea]|uniref:Uncharacterized protein n=1 Tax=Mycena albidolilacea TaxID=1033008 RepID=A0AAD6ZMK2_9AGAR|nr:hypothetical protein DFH08DRAFT_1084389 [Mycena albidolilacea]